LSDGTIWKWQRNFSWVPGFALGSIIVASLLLGVLLGITAVRVRRYLRSPIPQVKTPPEGVRNTNRPRIH
jgi:hypothetical protein